MIETKHWAESLNIADTCLVTIRHKTDGSKNIIKTNAIVADNSIATQELIVWVAERPKKVRIPYNEVTKKED